MSGELNGATRRFTITNRLGLHARAATLLVQAVTGLDAEVRIRKDDQEVDAKSILSLLTLAATQGTEIEVVARGRDASLAIEAIAALIEARFHEDD